MNPDDTQTPPTETAYRSRWGRFSPAMGWRAFWSEIVIVVLGVLIALAANEAVQEWSWREKVAEGEVLLRKDIEDISAVAAEAIVSAPCVDAQISALKDRLAGSGDTLIPAPVYSDEYNQDFLVRMPDRSFLFAKWHALIVDGTMLHIPAARQELYSGLDLYSARLEQLSAKNSEARYRLQVLAFPMPLEANVRKDLMVELIEQQQRYRAMQRLSQGFLRTAGNLNIRMSAAQLQSELEDSGTLAFCRAHGLPLADLRTVLKP